MHIKNYPIITGCLMWYDYSSHRGGFKTTHDGWVNVSIHPIVYHTIYGQDARGVDKNMESEVTLSAEFYKRHWVEVWVVVGAAF